MSSPPPPPPHHHHHLQQHHQPPSHPSTRQVQHSRHSHQSSIHRTPAEASASPCSSHSPRTPPPPPQRLSSSNSSSNSSDQRYPHALHRPPPDARFHQPRHAHYPHHDQPSRPPSALVRGSVPHLQHPLHKQHPQYPVMTHGSRPASHAYSAPLPSQPINFDPFVSTSEPDLRDYGYAGFAVRHGPPSGSSTRQASPHHLYSTYSVSDDGHESSPGPTVRQTVRSVMHLSFTAPLLSFAILLYTLFAMLMTLALAPLRLCLAHRPCFSSQLSTLLLPPLHLQLRCVFATSSASPLSRSSSSSSQAPLSSNEKGLTAPHGADLNESDIDTPRLVSTHLLAPLVALPLAVCAWVMGTAWALGAIVSDESAGDDRDERRFAERLVAWWAAWLNKGVDRGQSDAGLNAEERGRKREMGDCGTRVFV